MEATCQTGNDRSSGYFANLAVAESWAEAHLLRIMAEGPDHYFKEWREFRGLTQERAASRAKMSISVLSRLETGIREYKKEHLHGLAFAYGCQPWELLGKNPYIQDADIVDLFGQISADQREQAVAILRTFLREKAG